MVFVGNWQKDVFGYVRDADIEHLIAIGCPRDEYDPEARDIVTFLEEVDDKETIGYQDIFKVIVAIFTWWFGEDSACFEHTRVVDLANSICSRLGIIN